MVQSSSSSSVTSQVSADGGSATTSPFNPGATTLAVRRARGATDMTSLASAPTTSRHAPHRMWSPNFIGPTAGGDEGSVQQETMTSALMSAPFGTSSSGLLFSRIPAHAPYTSQSLGASSGREQDFQWNFRIPDTAPSSIVSLRCKSSFDSSGITEVLRSSCQLAQQGSVISSLQAPLSGHELDYVPAPNTWGLLPADTTTLHLDVARSVPPSREVHSNDLGPTQPGWQARSNEAGLHIGSTSASAIQQLRSTLSSTVVNNRPGALPLPWQSPGFGSQYGIEQTLESLNSSNDSSQMGSVPPSTSTSEGGSQRAAPAHDLGSTSSDSLGPSLSIWQKHQHGATSGLPPQIYGAFASALGSPLSSVPSAHDSNSREDVTSFSTSGSIATSISSSGQVLTDTSHFAPPGHRAAEGFLLAAQQQQQQYYPHPQLLPSPQQPPYHHHQQQSPQSSALWAGSSQAHSPNSPVAHIHRTFYELQQLSMSSPNVRMNAPSHQRSRPPSFISPDALGDVQGRTSSSATSPGSVEVSSFPTPSSILWQSHQQQGHPQQPSLDTNTAGQNHGPVPLAGELALFQDHYSGDTGGAAAQHPQGS
ncbi:unnamed protein product [Tilletia controversa]|uniref:Uncharacterized protein n=2 Tax=Tilletia TaxID=13289 RepID=A0A8T8SW47_9BASI|nr:hypothetical protein A4X03_0g6441 [Tilletia caries]CAD6909798.1 unnamed protein product [Tilletia controversa]CAD6962987.1 unnamed protein product [Tilletia laevis]CAD6890859.1 unnamed protein product [Tilletia caries]CAD6896782.1 unnamed protein product [Tilletia caries]